MSETSSTTPREVIIDGIRYVPEGQPPTPAAGTVDAPFAPGQRVWTSYRDEDGVEWRRGYDVQDDDEEGYGRGLGTLQIFGTYSVADARDVETRLAAL